MKTFQTSSPFASSDPVKTREQPVKAFLIKGSSEEDRLEKARQIIRDLMGTRSQWVYGCYSGENELAVILTRDPSYLYAMSFQEARERAETDGETIAVEGGPQLR